MADAKAILQASTALRTILQNELSVVSIAPDHIVIESIDLLPTPVPFPRVTIFLYNIRENAFLKNSPERLVATGTGTRDLTPPPAVLDLDYMICAWAAKTDDEHLLLGDIVRVLYDHPNLDAVDLGTEWKPDESIQISLANPTIEEQARIWTTFGFKRFKLSLYYKLRLVPIESMRTYREPLVSERSASPAPFTPPGPGDLPAIPA